MFLFSVHFCLWFFAGFYALSVRSNIDAQTEKMLHHYIIWKTGDGGYYIDDRLTFSSIIQLIDHYKGRGHASVQLCVHF